VPATIVPTGREGRREGRKEGGKVMAVLATGAGMERDGWSVRKGLREGGRKGGREGRQEVD
jgi:hypothetical protein